MEWVRFIEDKEDSKPPYYHPVLCTDGHNVFTAWLAWDLMGGYVWTINGTNQIHTGIKKWCMVDEELMNTIK